MSLKQVREFHIIFNRPVRDLPEIGTPAERALRVRLMLEEVLEFAKAASVKILIRTPDYVDNIDDLEIISARTDEPNLAAMLHELADVEYVVHGTAVQLGLPLQLAVGEIHKANMRKLGPDGKPVVDVRGKVRKPNGWQPADMDALLRSFTSDEIQYTLTDGSALTLTSISQTPGPSVAEVRDREFLHVGKPSPCLDPEKMNGYADQFPGTDEGTQYDGYVFDPSLKDTK